MGLNNYRNKKDTALFLGSFILTAVAIAVIFSAMHIYPFGEISILRKDMNIQYFDLFKYFKRCLEGKDSLFYSFNKSLGGTMIGLYAYYLSSPLNFLILFFDDIQLFVFVITVLKISLSALTLSVFLRKRFERLSSAYILILSLGFALGHYNLMQMCNIMWLDGVYMLPLLLLCVYQYVQEGNGIKLSICVGVMILFCWYISYMNCLFAVIYYFYEAFQAEHIRGWKYRIGHFLRFCFYEGMGVVLSGILFFPVIVEMVKGKGVSNKNIFVLTRNFYFADFMKAFFYSQDGKISLFCGTFVVMAVIAYFISKKVTKKDKPLSGILLFGMVVSMGLKFFENIWNGLRFATYYCRFGMLTMFAFVLVAACLLNKISTRKDYKVLITAAVINMIVIILIGFFAKIKIDVIIISLLFIVGYLILFIVMMGRHRGVAMISASMVLLAVTEMLVGGFSYLNNLPKDRYNKKASKYLEYESGQSDLVNKIHEEDRTFYRMDETKHRVDYKSGTTSFYNEGLAYGYKGIAHYSSAYDGDLSRFLMKLGYYYYVDITAYDEPILTSDSLLGMKYLMSERQYEGYSFKFKDKGKNVYENPYALPLAYSVSDDVLDFTDNSNLTAMNERYLTQYYRKDNPFIYQNQLYSAILGRDTELYIPLEYKAVFDEEKLKTNITLKQNNQLQGHKYLYYGWMNADVRGGVDGVVVDGEKICQYNYWNCFSVFGIGGSDEEHKLCLENYRLEQKDDLKLYALDLSLFEKAIENLKKNTPEIIQTAHTGLEISYQAKGKETLLVTIPYDNSWRIFRNGEEIEPVKVCGVLMAVPVEKGENIISMEYQYHYVYVGLGITICGLVILWVTYRIKKGREKI